MGFHRRIINEKVTQAYIDSNNLELLYSSEALIFTDEFSSKAFEFFKEGMSYDQINTQIKKYTNEKNILSSNS